MIVTVIYSLTGLLNWEGLKTSSLFAPVVGAGSVAGFYAFQRASAQVYHKVVDLMLFGTSVALWWQV